MHAAILGCSISGIAAYKLLNSLGYQVIGFDRKKMGNAPFIIHEDRVENFSTVDLLVVSPGVPPDHPIIKKAKSENIEVIGEIELALRHLKNQCIAVTGTNGKSTTTSLITHILNHMGVEAVSLGNIGVPLSEKVLNLKEKVVVVLELSSFQIEQIQTEKIEYACILNITEDHLDRYGSSDLYAKAKAKILEKVRKKIFINKNILKNFPFFSHSKAFFIDAKQNVATLNALGYTNLEGKSAENVLFSWYMVKEIVSEKSFSLKMFKEALSTFKAIEHRLEYIGEINGSMVYNDSKATNPDSVLYALETVTGRVVLMLGGEDKGLCFSKILEKKECISSLILFGKAREKLAKELFSLNPHLFSSMEEGVEFAFSQANKGTTLLFSPGCASYDAFKNYEERGSFFKKLFAKYNDGVL